MTYDKLYDKSRMMKTNVSGLMREFPKIRRAVFAGETVIVSTRDGEMEIRARKSEPRLILGSMKGMIHSTDDDLDKPTWDEKDWKPDPL